MDPWKKKIMGLLDQYWVDCRGELGLGASDHVYLTNMIRANVLGWSLRSRFWVDRMGEHDETVRKKLSRLREIQYAGEPLVEKIDVGSGKYKWRLPGLEAFFRDKEAGRRNKGEPAPEAQTDMPTDPIERFIQETGAVEVESNVTFGDPRLLDYSWLAGVDWLDDSQRRSIASKAKACEVTNDYVLSMCRRCRAEGYSDPVRWICGAINHGGYSTTAPKKKRTDASPAVRGPEETKAYLAEQAPEGEQYDPRELIHGLVKTISKGPTNIAGRKF